MKKTKKTMFTAALLSAAVTMQTQLLNPSESESEAVAPVYGPPIVSTTTTAEPSPSPVPLYGPPWVFYDKGDINMDGKTNIADLIRLKSEATGDMRTNWIELSDINGDGNLSKNDILMMERYLFGESKVIDETLPYTPSSDEPEDVPSPEPTVIQTVYGPSPAHHDNENTDPSPTPSKDPVITPPVTEPTFEPIYQTKYGCPPTLDPEVPEFQVVYGPPSFFENEDK